MIVTVAGFGGNVVAAELSTTFTMVGSAGVAVCLPDARGKVTVSTVGVVDNMHVEVQGLPANTDFDFFVIQVPTSPFGMAWYQGDIETDGKGKGVGDFTGRFSQETFVVAPGSATAPVIHSGTFPDASSNPATAPVHMYHVGLWFNSPTDAQNAGCSNAVTPFNGDHTAGIQVLNTSNFDNDKGPLRRFNP
jgi:hypothetical protein